EVSGAATVLGADCRRQPLQQGGHDAGKCRLAFKLSYAGAYSLLIIIPLGITLNSASTRLDEHRRYAGDKAGAADYAYQSRLDELRVSRVVNLNLVGVCRFPCESHPLNGT